MSRKREFSRRVRVDEILRVNTPCGVLDVQVRKRRGRLDLHFLELPAAWNVTLPPKSFASRIPKVPDS